jgi:choice-of-anchor C domain-containing protein
MQYIKKFLAGFAIGASLLFGFAPAFAASLINNGGFEAGTEPGAFTQVNAGGTNITDWIVNSGSVDYIGTYWNASEGSRSIDLSGSEAGVISQTFTTVIGNTYKVTFDLAGNPAGGPTVKTLTVSATGGTTDPYTFDTTGKTTIDMGWTSKTYNFVATSTSTTLTFASTTAGYFGPALDNVVVEAVTSNKDQCKNNGWKTFTNPAFKNQGDCVSYIQSNANAVGNKTK